MKPREVCFYMVMIGIVMLCNKAITQSPPVTSAHAGEAASEALRLRAAKTVVPAPFEVPLVTKKPKAGSYAILTKTGIDIHVELGLEKPKDGVVRAQVHIPVN
jgi:hypothetical protein